MGGTILTNGAVETDIITEAKGATEGSRTFRMREKGSVSPGENVQARSSSGL